MTWHLDKNRPLCPQICEFLCAKIATGALKPGCKVMSVREVAIAAGVNPNTVQHAFSLLEQQGVLYSVRGAGWFVNQDTSAAMAFREAKVKEKTQGFFAELAALGIGAEEAKTLVKEWEYV